MPGTLQVGGNEVITHTGDAGAGDVTVNVQNKLVLDSSGKVGVGTNSPNKRLSVLADSGEYSIAVQASAINLTKGYAITGPDGSVEGVFTSNAATGEIRFGGIPANYFITCYTSGAERMRILSDGSVTIGGTISNVPLGVYGNATWCAVFRDSGGTDRHYFYANGSAANTSGSIGTISDERLKENITDAAPKLSDIMRLRVINYNLIGDSNKQLGFLAHEFEQVFPSLVFETDTRPYDEDGNLTKGLADQKIIKAGLDFAILTKAIQEQQALIESQQSQIDALTARIDALENK